MRLKTRRIVIFPEVIPKRQLYFTLFLLFFSLSITHAQQKFAISGTIKEKKSGEALIGATVHLVGLPQAGSVTNAYGFYSLQAASGTYVLVASYQGFKSDSVKISLEKNLSLTIELDEQATALQEVTVTTKMQDENVSMPLMGVQKLSIKEINNVPVIFGERDVMKTIQLLPGIKSAGEGSSGFFVRGGASDQNLILLDEATVYNASHLLGFFSAFNSDAIKDLTLYKGAMPAEYGGRLSSVVDIKMNDGSTKDYHVNGGIGLIASRLTVDGPIAKNKGSFIVSARRTYADLFLRLSNDSTINNNSLYFYDLNAKASYQINEKNKVFVSGYLGSDVLGFGDIFGIDFGNTTATARWNHIFNSKLFSNTSLIYSNYKYNISLDTNTDDLTIKSKIEDYAIKQDFQFYVNNSSRISFGLHATRHRISPGAVETSESSNFNPVPISDNYSLESAVYASHEVSILEKLKINYGLRLNAFSLMGPGELRLFDVAGNVAETNSYGDWEIAKTYWNLEPRFSASYQFNAANSIKASYTRNVQNLHLLSNSVATSPTDLWIPSSLNVKPEIADQASLGYYRNLMDNNYELSSEVYYKAMQNQIDYKNGAELQANVDVETQLLFGKGRAYGLELYLKKKTGRFTGWVSYTLARSERKIDGINNGEWYVARQDQTHNLAVVGIYQATKRLTLSSNFVYNTGNAISFPSGKYSVNAQTAFYYTERNGYRLPAFHRLDFAATLLDKKKKRWEGSWTFSVYNAYGRQNAYTIAFEDHPDDPSRTRAVQTALFRWVPSVTYNFKF